MNDFLRYQKYCKSRHGFVYVRSAQQNCIISGAIEFRSGADSILVFFVSENITNLGFAFNEAEEGDEVKLFEVNSALIDYYAINTVAADKKFDGADVEEFDELATITIEHNISGDKYIFEEDLDPDKQTLVFKLTEIVKSFLFQSEEFVEDENQNEMILDLDANDLQA